MQMQYKLKLNFLTWWVGGWLRNNPKLMLHSTLDEVEVKLYLDEHMLLLF